MIKACNFDLGGTIVDRYSLTPLLSLKETFNKRKLYIPNKLLFKDMGNHKREHIRHIINNENISNSWYSIHGNKPGEKEVSDLYHSFNEIQKKKCIVLMDILPETKKTIQYLKNNNINVGCTTGLNQENMLLIKDKLNNNNIHLDSYVSSSCLKNSYRPNPGMIHANMKKLKINNPKEVIKIDDTNIGIKEGLNAGCWTIAVSRWSINMEIASIDDAYSLLYSQLIKKNNKSKQLLENQGQIILSIL